MTNRFLLPFTPVDTTAPSFQVTVDSTSVATALQSTGVREWFGGPGSRSIRIASITADDYHIQFGSTLAVATTTTTPVILGGTVEIFTPVKPAYTHIAIVSSTDVTANITLGYGA